MLPFLNIYFCLSLGKLGNDGERRATAPLMAGFFLSKLYRLNDLTLRGDYCDAMDSLCSNPHFT